MLYRSGQDELGLKTWANLQPRRPRPPLTLRDLVTASERLIPPKQMESATKYPSTGRFYRYCRPATSRPAALAPPKAKSWVRLLVPLQEHRPEQYWWPRQGSNASSSPPSASMLTFASQYLLAKEDLKYFAVLHKMSKNRSTKSISSTLGAMGPPVQASFDDLLHPQPSTYHPSR